MVVPTMLGKGREQKRSRPAGESAEKAQRAEEGGGSTAHLPPAFLES